MDIRFGPNTVATPDNSPPVIDRVLGGLGLSTPTRRFIAIGGITAGLLWYFKPDSMFFDGYARPWAMTSPFRKEEHEMGSVIPPTTLPWWLAAIVAGAGAALFL